MSIPNFARKRSIFIPILFLTLFVTLAGCGGGGGSGTTNPQTFNIGGQITTTPTRAATRSTLPAGIPVTGYLWPDLNTVVAMTTTDANGRYTLAYPHSDTGKAAVIVAVQTVGGVTIRYSAILANLTGSSIVDANVDPATTLTAELVLATAQSPPSISNLSSSAVVTIDSEFKNWSGIGSADINAPGTNLPAALGGGLKASGPANTFLQSDAVIQAELKLLSSSTDQNVANGRATIQMARSLIFGVVSNAQSEQTSISAAMNTQQQTVTNGVKGASAFSSTLKFISGLLGGNPNAEFLKETPPGTYTQNVSSDGKLFLRYIGNSPDGKSWIVTDMAGDSTNGQVATFTPTNSIPLFKTDPSAGIITLSVVNPSDSMLAYNVQLTPTSTGSNVTNLKMTANLKDATLTQPITFTGNMTGVPAAGSTGSSSYSNLTFSGSLQSQFGQIQVTNLAAQWAPSSKENLLQNLQKVTIDSLMVTTGFTPSASLSVTKLEVDFDLTVPFDRARIHLKNVAFSGEFKASGYDLVVTNFSLGFVPVTVTGGNTEELPSTAQGQLTYTSPQLGFQGSVQGTWTNPSLNTGTIAGFPQGNLHLTGSLTPMSTGVLYAADVLLSGSVNGTNGVGTLKLNSIKLGTQTLNGTITATYPSVNGKIDSSQATYLGSMTQQPTGVQLNLSGKATNLTGTLTVGGSGTTKIADIGSAKTLGLIELGNATIIKYTDNTFESAESILP